MGMPSAGVVCKHGSAEPPKLSSALQGLSAKQSEALEGMKRTFPEADALDLFAFLRARRYDEAKATAMFRAAQDYWADGTTGGRFKNVNIAEIAPFLRSPPGTEGPDGAIVCLEDGEGGCLRDKRGRPILMSIGMAHGTVDEMERQNAYVMKRSATHALPGQLKHGACVVIECAPRSKANRPTFRFPDKDVRRIFDIGKTIYPGSLTSTTHFCGLPRHVTWAFKLCRPFMEEEAYNNIRLHTSFANLKKYIDNENMLARWGGTADFDLDEYVSWRAREEGVSDALDKQIKDGMSSGGAVRRFSPSGSSDDALSDSASAAMTLADVRVQLEDGDGVACEGVLSKQGSGGLFGTTRWKEKFALCGGGSLFYFDEARSGKGGTDAFVAQKVSRLVSLLGATVEDPPSRGGGRSRVENEESSGTEDKVDAEGVTSGTDDAATSLVSSLLSAVNLGGGSGVFVKGASATMHKFPFAVRCPQRDYRFGCATSAERNRWIEVIRAQIVVAENMSAKPNNVSVEPTDE